MARVPAAHPNGYQYSWFCERYRARRRRLDVVMRQVHRAGEKAFVDYAGPKFPVVDPSTGEVSDAILLRGRSRRFEPHLRGREPKPGAAGLDDVACRYEPQLARPTGNWPPTTEPPCCQRGPGPSSGPGEGGGRSPRTSRAGSWCRYATRRSSRSANSATPSRRCGRTERAALPKELRKARIITDVQVQGRVAGLLGVSPGDGNRP